MTRFQALYIKYCRVNLGCSWRVIHSMWFNRYVLQIPFDLSKHIDIDQMHGRELCFEAEKLLQENFDEDYVD